jgi:hypothetical protein
MIKAHLCGSRFAAAVAEVAIAVDDQGRHSSRHVSALDEDALIAATR